MKNEISKAIAEKITSAINNCCFRATDVAIEISKEHRYLQSEFAKLCIEYLRLASEKYEDGDYDDRNEYEFKSAHDIITKGDIK